MLIRPEPQAIWEPVLSDAEWKKQAHAHFTREQKDNFRYGEEVKGGWKKLKPIQESWQIEYAYQSLNLTFKIEPAPKSQKEKICHQVSKSPKFTKYCISSKYNLQSWCFSVLVSKN